MSHHTPRGGGGGGAALTPWCSETSDTLPPRFDPMNASYYFHTMGAWMFHECLVTMCAFISPEK